MLKKYRNKSKRNIEEVEMQEGLEKARMRANTDKAASDGDDARAG